MSKLQLRVSDSTVISIPIPSLKLATKSENRRELLASFVKYLAYLVLGGGLLGMGFIFQWVEFPVSEIPFLFFVWILFITGLMIATVILQGWKVLVDPPVFVQVLLFALLVVGMFLIAPIPVRLSQRFIGVNTFGFGDIKYMSGIYVMGFVGLFYTMHFFIRQRVKLNVLVDMLVAGFSLVSYLVVLDQSLVNKFSDLIPIGMFVLFLYVLFGKRSLVTLLATPAAVLSLAVTLQNYMSVEIIIAVIASLTTTLVLMLSAQDWRLESPLKTLKQSVRNYLSSEVSLKESVQTNGIPLTIAAFIGWFLISVVWMLANQQALTEFVGDISTTFTTVFNQMEGIGWLIGRGITRDPSGVFLANILMYQGLVGIAAYGTLFVTAIYVSIKAVKRDLPKSSDFHFASYLLLPVIVFVPVLGAISHVDFILVALWWVAFSMLSIDTIVEDQQLITKVVSRFSVGKYQIAGKLPWIQIGLMIVVLGFIIRLVPLLRDKLV